MRSGAIALAALLVSLAGCAHHARPRGPLEETRHEIRAHGPTRTVGYGVIQDGSPSLYYHRGRWYRIPGHRHGPGCGHVLVHGTWRLVAPADDRPLCR